MMIEVTYSYSDVIDRKRKGMMGLDLSVITIPHGDNDTTKPFHKYLVDLIGKNDSPGIAVTEGDINDK